jgi:propanol-preferring alcohol dehydrogenase
MKAWVLTKTAPLEEGTLELAEIETPSPADGEILIEVSTCGICRTDLHTIEGEIETPVLPIIPGHQAVGRVIETGRGVTKIKLGERVGVPWLHYACGKCAYCLDGLENLCDEPCFTGLHVNGGYAEFMTAHVDFVYPLPDSFDDVHSSPLLCAGIIGYRALRLAGLKRGAALGMFGFGASAHLALQVAVYEGAEVYVFTRSEKHREHALELGAAWAGSADDAPPKLLASAVSFAPAGSIIPKAMERLDKGGTLALAGIYVDDVPRMNYEKHLFHEKHIRSVTAFTRTDAASFLKVADEAGLRTDVKVYRFGSAIEALEDLKHSRINGAAVLKIK